MGPVARARCITLARKKVGFSDIFLRLTHSLTLDKSFSSVGFLVYKLKQLNGFYENQEEKSRLAR